MATEKRDNEASASCDCYLRILSEFGFDSDDEMRRYFRNEMYTKDGFTADDLASDVQKGLNVIREQCSLLNRALTIINDAIMHGMPVTPEVSEVSNSIRGTD